ncbi:MAG: universal stress protein [Methylococcales symbiont of Hymedesmia sp. n. MRB-2018]|nr:MAG: universal stress protein [Methylococcales symbiont of Hymedesmia sp. n. MRB-2018]KAF3984400.1 MAG: universal stress protein [Methylococcales symbiont of Hymedesmia sp. n. MRB-2018]
MSCYQHILLAADFTEHGKKVADKAKQLAKLHQARLSIIHVMDNIPITDAIYGPIIPFDGDLTEQLMVAAKKQLAKMAADSDILETNQYMELGSPKRKIVKIAKEQNVDLIVVGSHGRHGLALLLGSTANGVLHHAACDVLAVRLKND